MKETADFINKLDRVSKTLKYLPEKMAITAVNFSKERFVQKNWVDTKREPWEPRKRKARGTLMIQTGRLKRSIRKLYATHELIMLGTDVPYAQIHNDGGTITETVNVKAHKRKITIAKSYNLRTRNASRNRVSTGQTTDVKAHQRQINLTIPARPFLGQSAVLMRRLERLIVKELKNAIK